jgi:hypothetical protein
MALTTALLCGGPHDGERIERPPEDPLPERLVAIVLDDGSDYARVGEQDDASTGETLLRLGYDADGSLTRAAKQAMGLDPDAPCHRLD